jgi:tetratricopeptide (TPR) repeat protein
MEKDYFDKEWDAAIIRFSVQIGFTSLNITLQHPITRKPTQPHIAIPDTFNQWKKIKSLWDRRSLLFDVISDLVGQQMKNWQIANYLTVQRVPLEALDIILEDMNDLQKKPQGDFGEDYIPYCLAVAKTLISLTQYQEALKWVQKAFHADPNSSQVELLLADVYFLSGHCDQANAIYQKHWSIARKYAAEPVVKIFSEVLSCEYGTSSSPVFAIQLGKNFSDSLESEEYWQLTEAEFYSSPYFRAHHAYHLANQGKLHQSFAKLLALVQEMPWLKEASLNLLRHFEHLDPSGNQLMPETRTKLLATIESNGWMTELDEQG